MCTAVGLNYNGDCVGAVTNADVCERKCCAVPACGSYTFKNGNCYLYVSVLHAWPSYLILSPTVVREAVPCFAHRAGGSPLPPLSAVLSMIFSPLLRKAAVILHSRSSFLPSDHRALNVAAAEVWTHG